MLVFKKNIAIAKTLLHISISNKCCFPHYLKCSVCISLSLSLSLSIYIYIYILFYIYIYIYIYTYTLPDILFIFI